jgi:phage terminase large subunit-like protein
MTDDLFTAALSAASGEDWDEMPVPIETFVTDEYYLGLPPLSDLQYQIVKAATQIYKRDTLISLYGEKDGEKRWQETYNEIVLMLGKGSGKDHCSVIAVCYVVYLLLCLKDPSGYYGNPTNEPIDIINVAINADQARTVFFNRFRDRVEGSPWFNEGPRGARYQTGNNVIDFNKNIHAYSGHSQREAFEGKNLIFAILDEISAFALESNTGNDLADTADATYNMYSDSVTSRYAEFGKVMLLSFPRFYGDYIMQRYGPEFNDIDKGMIGAVAEKETIMRQHTFKINEDMPDDIEGNEFTIEWEEDHIVRYRDNRVFAMRRPSWEVNPTKNIEMYKKAFLTNPGNAYGKFACMPSDQSEHSFIKDKQAIEEAFRAQNGVDSDGHYAPNFHPKDGTEYYIHVDLSKVHDRCAVAMAHVDKWVTMNEGYLKENEPVVRVDAVRWWKPSKMEPMDYKKVTDYILDLKRKGFNIKLVTFDRWQSNDTMNFLEKHHIKTEMLSVANKHYDDFLSVLYDQRLVGPKVPELIEELRQLRYIKDKIDHPRTGYKDLSDAVCGAIFDAVTWTTKPQNQNVEVITYKSLMRTQEQERVEDNNRRGVITPPKKKEMPAELRREVDSISLSAIRLI